VPTPANIIANVSVEVTAIGALFGDIVRADVQSWRKALAGGIFGTVQAVSVVSGSVPAFAGITSVVEVGAAVGTSALLTGDYNFVRSSLAACGAY